MFNKHYSAVVLTMPQSPQLNTEPFGEILRRREACYRADDRALAAKVLASVKRDLQEQQKYYVFLDDEKKANLQYENTTVENLMNALNEMEQKFNAKNKDQIQEQ